MSVKYTYLYLYGFRALRNWARAVRRWTWELGRITELLANYAVSLN